MGAEHSSLVVDLSGFVPRRVNEPPEADNMNYAGAFHTPQTAATSDPVAELQAAADVIRLGRDKDQSEAALRRMEAIHRRMNTYIHELQKQNKELKEKTQKQARMLKLQEKSLQSWKKLYENFGERQFSVKK